MNLFKTNVILLLRTVRKKKKLFLMNIYILQNQYGTNIWKLSRLPNNPKLGKMKSIKQNSESIDYSRKLKIGRHSKILLKDKMNIF